MDDRFRRDQTASNDCQVESQLIHLKQWEARPVQSPACVATRDQAMSRRHSDSLAPEPPTTAVHPSHQALRGSFPSGYGPSYLGHPVDAPSPHSAAELVQAFGMSPTQ